MNLVFLMLSVLLFFNRSYAQEAGLVPVFEEQVASSLEPRLELTNMPRVRTADTIGMCQSFAPAVLLDYARCVDINTEDCQKLGADEEASPLDLNRMGDYRKSSDSFQYEFEGVRDSGKGVNSEGKMVNIAGDHILQRAAIIRSYAPESCAPFSQLVNKSSSYEENKRLHYGVWERLKKNYQQFHELKKNCPTCADQFAATAMDSIKQDFDLKVPNTQILKAFSADMYDRFLEQLLIPSACKLTKNRVLIEGPWEYRSFPVDGVQTNFEKTVQKIKEVIRDKKVPVMIPLCLDERLSKSFSFDRNVCKNGHNVVVHGYRKIKDKKGNIRHLVRVQNNWGKKWQDDNNQGWLDASELLFRTGFGTSTLAWIEKSN